MAAENQRINPAYPRRGINGIGMNGYGNQYASRSGSHMQHGISDISGLSNAFQGMNLQNTGYGSHVRNSAMAGAAAHVGGTPVTGSMQSSMYSNSAPYMYQSSYGSGSNAQMPGMYTPHASHFMAHMGYQHYQQHDNSPMSQTWTPTTGAGAEVPNLITPRRDSVSSTENDQPATPSYANYSSMAHGGVAINRSPSGVFTHSTPSPTSMISPYGVQLVKQPDHSDISPQLKLLITREPAIPHAIPAPSSPVKALDRALENQRGETNVYIRGLLPETTDAMLEAWGSRFGDIKSSKSIIDMNNGLCKG